MTLAELQTRTLEWIDDPSGSYFAPGGDLAQITWAIDHGYQTVVAYYERSKRPWNIHDTPVSVAVLAGTREYSVTPAVGQPAIRRIVSVTRVQDDQGREREQDEISYAERNRYRRFEVARLGDPPADAWYVYRTAAGVYRIGLADIPGESWSMKVYYSPVIEPLVASDDAPAHIPAQWQPIICLLAARALLNSVNRSTQAVDREYAEQIRLMLEESGTLTTMRSRAWR